MRAVRRSPRFRAWSTESRRSSTRFPPSDALRSHGALTELSKLVETAAAATSIAHITQAREAAEGAYDRALTRD